MHCADASGVMHVGVCGCLVDCPRLKDFCYLDLSVFHDQYQWEIWKNIAQKSDSGYHGSGGEDNGDIGAASGGGHSGGDDIDDGGGGVYRGCGGGGGGPLK